MLDTHGIMEWLRLITGASHVDAAGALPYYTNGPIYRPVMSLSNLHSTVDWAILCAQSEADMMQQCSVCQKSFRVKPSHAERTHCCSRACNAVHMRHKMQGENNPNYQERISKNCPVCQKEFRVKPSQAARRVCCSRGCYKEHQKTTMQGVNNPNYRGVVRFSKVRVKKARPLKQLDFLNQCGFRWCECVKCGKEFQFSHKSKKYCPKCKPQGEYYKRCQTCKKEFSTDMKRKIFCTRECYSVAMTIRQKGEKSHRWKGGLTRPDMLLRSSKEYKDWRKAVYARDDYTCQLCFERGGKLAAHHIREYAKHHDLRLDVRNGITLCWPCHQGIKGKEQRYENTFYDITGGTVNRKVA